MHNETRQIPPTLSIQATQSPSESLSSVLLIAAVVLSCLTLRVASSTTTPAIYLMGRYHGFRYRYERPTG